MSNGLAGHPLTKVSERIGIGPEHSIEQFVSVGCPGRSHPMPASGARAGEGTRTPNHLFTGDAQERPWPVADLR